MTHCCQIYMIQYTWYTGNPAVYHDKLKEKTITSAGVYSGNVRIRADDMVLVISAPIRFHMQNDKLPGKHQLYIEFGTLCPEENAFSVFIVISYKLEPYMEAIIPKLSLNAAELYS